MYCPKCGTHVESAEDRYCAKCGASLPLSTGTADAPISLGAARDGGQNTRSASASGDESANASGTQSQEFAPTAALFFCVAAILTTIGIAALWYAFSVSKGDIDPSDRIPYLIGYYFWVPLLVYAVWRSALKRRRGAGLLLGSVAFMAIALYQSQAIIHEATMDRRAFTKIHTMLLELMNGKVIRRAELRDTGEYRPLLLTARQYEIQLQNDYQQYQKQIVAAGIYGTLSPHTFESATAISKGILLLDQLRQSADQTESKILKDYDGMSRAVQSTNIPATVREDFVSGFDMATVRSKSACKQYFDIERGILGTATEILKFMRGRRGFFAVSDNKLMFARHADLITYNNYLAQLRAEAEQETAWRKTQRNLIAQKAEAVQSVVNSIGH